MRYLPTIDVHEKATQQAIVSGQIKLQPGQWVACSNSRKSYTIPSDNKREH